MRNPFLVSCTVDFPDDVAIKPYTRSMLRRLLDCLRWIGVRRVYWNYYTPGMWTHYAQGSNGSSIVQTLKELGDPMVAACDIAHDLGLQFYAVIKPYETGDSQTYPLQSAEVTGRTGLPRIGGVTAMPDPWVLAHPQMRLRHRGGETPAWLQSLPVQKIELRQQDMTPVRIRAENIEIWTSHDNACYRRKDAPFTFHEGTASCDRDVYDSRGNLVSSKGDTVRTLTLTGLDLRDPFVAITTNLDDNTGSFRNVAVEMVRAFGPGDQHLPIVVASHKSVQRRPRDLRKDSLEYDEGHQSSPVCLDVTNQRPVCVCCVEKGISYCRFAAITPDVTPCRDGVIAFARGRNAYVPASLCEAYPEVREFWLSWVDECMRAGVDGLVVRISNHSCWTDHQEMYGFNEPVLAEYQRRYGADPDVDPYDPELLGALRGQFFDQFLWAAKRKLAAAGKRLEAYIEVESFRRDGPLARQTTRPGNIVFNWRDWLHSGLLDEAMLMTCIWTPQQALDERLGREVVREAAAAGVPLYLRYFLFVSREGAFHANLLESVYRAGLAGYNLYEAASLYDVSTVGPDRDWDLSLYPGLAQGIHDRIVQLGL